MCASQRLLEFQILTYLIDSSEHGKAFKESLSKDFIASLKFCICEDVEYSPVTSSPIVGSFFTSSRNEKSSILKTFT